MNNLVYIKNNYNVVSICFLRNKKICSRLYDWYLPYFYSDKISINEDIKIKVNDKIKTVRIINLTYHPLASTLYKPLPILKNQPSWQIRKICNYLQEKGIPYTRERCFKGLNNMHGKPLLVDISFEINGQWHLIEYHGVHHYFQLYSTLKRFNNIRQIMEIKRYWSKKNKVPYLEIPFFKQNEIDILLEQFLEGKY